MFELWWSRSKSLSICSANNSLLWSSTSALLPDDAGSSNLLAKRAPADGPLTSVSLWAAEGVDDVGGSTSDVSATTQHPSNVANAKPTTTGRQRRQRRGKVGERQSSCWRRHERGWHGDEYSCRLTTQSEQVRRLISSVSQLSDTGGRFTPSTFRAALRPSDNHRLPTANDRRFNR